MRGGTFFSGIGAPECAMPWVDWRWAAEIDPFASAVHAARFPGILNLGDVTRIEADAVEPVDLVVFGSPCQSFSVAGKRLGLDDPRGSLAIIALRLIGRVRPRWLAFENVPGLLSSDGGRDFGAFLGLLGQCGYGFAYRVLDAQFAGVPQRRRRIFVVGYLGDWRPPAAVLFEPESLRGDSAPRREAGQTTARPIGSCLEGGSGYRNDADTADNLIAYRTSPNCGAWATGNRTDALTTSTDPASHLIAFNNTGNGWWNDADAAATIRKGDLNGNGGARESTIVAYGGNRQSGPVDVATAVNAHGGPHGKLDFETETFVTHSLRADGFDASEDRTGRGTPLTLAIRGRGESHDLEYRNDGTANAILTPNGGRAGIGVGAIAWGIIGGAQKGKNHAYRQTVSGCLQHKGLAATGNEAGTLLQSAMQVRRLTPREAERLQGFPDDFTLIQYRGKPAADGPRYRALGNSMAVPVVRWIGHRIQLFEQAMASLAKGSAAA